MIAKVGLRMEVYLRAKAGFAKPSLRKPRSEEPRVTVFSIFAGPLPFAITSLGAKNSYSTLKTAESYWKFFQQIAILEQSKVKKKKSFKPF